MAPAQGLHHGEPGVTAAWTGARQQPHGGQAGGGLRCEEQEWLQDSGDVTEGGSGGTSGALDWRWSEEGGASDIT